MDIEVVGKLVQVSADASHVGVEFFDGPGQLGQPGMFAGCSVGKVNVERPANNHGSVFFRGRPFVEFPGLVVVKPDGNILCHLLVSFAVRAGPFREAQKRGSLWGVKPYPAPRAGQDRQRRVNCVTICVSCQSYSPSSILFAAGFACEIKENPAFPLEDRLRANAVFQIRGSVAPHFLPVARRFLSVARIFLPGASSKPPVAPTFLIKLKLAFPLEDRLRIDAIFKI